MAPFRALLTLALAALPGAAGASSAGGSIALFTIVKSENKNQVQYAVHVSDDCTPLGAAPVYAYWRMLERGPNRTEALLAQEEPAYGLASQVVTSREAHGGRIRAVLHAVPSRAIEVDVARAPNGICSAAATTIVAGAPARLVDVYAKLRWPFGVEYLLLQGVAPDGRAVRETVHGG